MRPETVRSKASAKIHKDNLMACIATTKVSIIQQRRLTPLTVWTFLCHVLQMNPHIGFPLFKIASEDRPTSRYMKCPHEEPLNKEDFVVVTGLWLLVCRSTHKEPVQWPWMHSIDLLESMERSTLPLFRKMVPFKTSACNLILCTNVGTGVSLRPHLKHETGQEECKAYQKMKHNKWLSRSRIKRTHILQQMYITECFEFKRSAKALYARANPSAGPLFQGFWCSTEGHLQLRRATCKMKMKCAKPSYRATP